MLGGISLTLIFCLFILDCVRFGWGKTLTSSFWVFTVFFTLSYPVKYLLIGCGVEYQAPTKPDGFSLSIALVIATCFWLLVYFIKGQPTDIYCSSPHQLEPSNARRKEQSLASKTILLFMVIISAIVFYELHRSTGSLSLAFQGNEQNESRVGHGHNFLLYTLYFQAFLIALFSNRRPGHRFAAILIASALALGVMEMTLLGTRRPIYLIGYALILFWFAQNRNNINIVMLGVYPVAMALLAPLGQAMRYSFESVLTGKGLDYIGSMEYILTSIGSTFEGIEHLANYLDKVTYGHLLLGVDQGTSWLFNSGLSLMPRAIWESKPYLYGSVAQQAYLYPEMYQSGFGQATFPSGIIVDAAFGFGIIGIFLFAAFYAQLFRYLDKVIFLKIQRFRFDYLIAASIYINMFNLVRGGTSIVMMVVMLMVFAFPINFLDRIRLRRFAST